MTSQLNQQSVMRGRRLGRQQACREMAATERTFNVEKNTANPCGMVSSKNTVHDVLPPTQQPSGMTSQSNQQSVIRGRCLGRQQPCQEMAATDMPFSMEKNTANPCEMLSSKNTVHNELPPTQPPSVMTSRLNQ